jgi:hypothetical protein
MSERNTISARGHQIACGAVDLPSLRHCLLGEQINRKIARIAHRFPHTQVLGRRLASKTNPGNVRHRTIPNPLPKYRG